MSEENMNKNEETSALFVSTQKKKQAEEEARRKAEEEQARREAAEAEVRRMEAEVEERKREVEEQKKAAEEAAAAAQNSAKQQETTAKIAGNKNIIKYVGIGVAALIVLIIIFAVVGSKKSSKIDFSNLVFDKEYMSSQEGYDVVIRYPGSLYSDVTEETEEKQIEINFIPVDSSIPEMSVSLVNTGFQIYELQAMPQTTQSLVNDKLKDFRDEGAVTEEELCDLTDDNTENYEYSCNGSIAEANVPFAAGVWLEPNRAGQVVIIRDMYLGMKDDDATKDNVKQLCEAFYNENSAEIVKTPGHLPLDDINYNGEIIFEELGLKVPVPEGRFKPLDESHTSWCDDNGAMIFLDCNGNLDVGALQEGDQDYLYDLKDYYLAQAEDGLTDFSRMSQEGIESRSFIKETEAYADWQLYAEFTTVREQCKYWERDFFSIIMNEETGGNFCIVTYIPEKTKGSYEGMLDEAFKNIATI